MRKIILYCLFVFCVVLVNAQGITLSGVVKAKADSSSLQSAGIMLLSLPDSAIQGELSGENGNFTFENLKKGTYRLTISYLGYKEYQTVLVLDKPITLPTILLESEELRTGEVNITAKLPTAIQKGDTTQFNASAFKTNPDASAEDLVLKMPGVSQQNGKVQAQGEEVKRVTVNGKPFFGDDPNAVLKNIPAEMIDKIQVFDGQSEQAQFTGFEDGNTAKTINIVTKPEFSNGVFGRTYAGYGTNSRYKVGGNLNYFKKERRISVVGFTNNINEQNFTSDDLMGVMSSGGPGGGGRGGPGGGRRDNFSPSENFLTAQQTGITTTHAAGINYVDKWGKNTEVTGSWFGNFSNNAVASTLFRQYILPEQAGQTYSEALKANAKNMNHRLNLRLEYEIDSMRSIVAQSRFSFQNKEGLQTISGVTLADTAFLNQTQNKYLSDGNGYTLSNSLLYKHKFRKKGRTVSVSINQGQNQTQNGYSLEAENIYYQSNIDTDTLNQTSNLLQNGMNVGGNVNYTDPLGKKIRLQLSAGTNFTQTRSDKKTIEIPSEIIDSLLSNQFENRYFTHNASSGIRFQDKKINFSAELSYQRTQLLNHQSFPNAYELSRNFDNILPNFRLQFKFNQNQNLRIHYRTATNIPTVTQLQEVVNNTNPIRVSTGNASLNQAFIQTLMGRYSAVNIENASSFFTLINASYITNYIGNEVFAANSDTILYGIPLAKGTQLSRPVNLNGYFSVRTLLTYGIPVKPLRSNLNLSLSFNYTRTPGLINQKLNISDAPNAGVNLVISSNVSTALDFTVSSNSNLNYIKNRLQPASNSFYLNQVSMLKFNYILNKRLVFQTEATHTYYVGLSQSFNQQFLLWNVGAGYKFLKNKNAEIRLIVFDVLKQNTSIQRNLTETSIEDVQAGILSRYAMLRFTWNFKKPLEKTPQ